MNIEDKINKSLEPKQKNKVGRRLGVKNSTVKMRRTSINMEENIYQYIFEEINKDYSKTLSSVVNNALKDYINKQKISHDKK